MTIYIATSLDNADEAKALSDALAEDGIGTTYKWWTHGSVWEAKMMDMDCAEASRDGYHSDDAVCRWCGKDLLAYRDSLEASQERCADAASNEMQGVKDADIVVVILCDEVRLNDADPHDDHGYLRLWPKAQRGTHTELGMAIALGKPVLLFASSASRFESNETCAFYFAPTVTRCVLPDAFTRVRLMEVAVHEYRSHTFNAGFICMDCGLRSIRDTAAHDKVCEKRSYRVQPAPAKEVAPPDGFYRLEDGSVHDQPVYWHVVTYDLQAGPTPVMWGLARYRNNDNDQRYVRGGEHYTEWRAKNPGARLIPDYDRTGPAPATPPSANPASHSGYGHDTAPAYYTNNPDGKETIDRMFEEAQHVLYRNKKMLAALFASDITVEDVDQALNAALCAAMALKYEDRAGRKGDSEGDKAKAAFYRQMQARWEQNNPDLDPRKKRKE